MSRYAAAVVGFGCREVPGEAQLRLPLCAHWQAEGHSERSSLHLHPRLLCRSPHDRDFIFFCHGLFFVVDALQRRKGGGGGGQDVDLSSIKASLSLDGKDSC